MKVKKVKAEWYPSENKELRVGETIEITDPKYLILTGMVVAIDKDGSEVSTYDLYGVVAKDEKKEFEEWLALKKQKSLNSSLEEEAIKLAKELKGAQIQPEASKVAIIPTEQKLSWPELQNKARELGVYKVGMDKEAVEAAIKNAK